MGRGLETRVRVSMGRGLGARVMVLKDRGLGTSVTFLCVGDLKVGLGFL